MSDGASFAPGPRSDKDSFFSKMKKKPDVQAVLDHLDNYTVEDIENLKGPHFPQWIRDALVKRKTGMANADVLSRAERIAEKMNEYHRLNTK